MFHHYISILPILLCFIIIFLLSLKVILRTNQGSCFIDSPLLFLVQPPHHLKKIGFWFSDPSLDFFRWSGGCTKNKSGLSIKHEP